MSHPSPLTPARQHAHALADAGDVAGAIAVLEHAVSLARIDLGEDDPGILAASHQLGQLHAAADDPSAARRVLEDAYAAGLWRLGDADPLMLEISYDIGTVAQELGNRHEARKAFTRVIEFGAPVLGHDHWLVAQARAHEAGVEAARALDAPTTYQPVIQPIPRMEPTRIEPIRPEQQAPVPRFAQRSQPGIPYETPPSASGRRGTVVFATVVAVAAVVIAVIALGFALTRGDSAPEQPDQPVLGGGPPPTEVAIADRGAEIEVTWAAPKDQRTPFIVTAGAPGGDLATMGRVEADETSFKLKGLNAQIDYCFAVLAVYSENEYASSPQVCTTRTRSN